MTAGTIYVLCPDHDKPSGGIKILYRHVDVLTRHGVASRILHQQPGFRCTWFANSTPVAYLPEVQLTSRDFLVVPEIYGPNIVKLGDSPHIGRAVRKVIFNQNAYYTFLGYDREAILAPAFSMPYAHTAEFPAAIVVSEDSEHYLGYAFPGLRVFRIHNAIDGDLFACDAPKRRQICYMPRKHPEDALQVFAILRARGRLEGMQVIAIDGMPEAQVAAVMKESLIFLSFGYPEGCPLPPAEAMASGCIVIGYHGLGGREYFLEDFSYPVAINDIVGYVRCVERVLDAFDADPAAVREMGQRASRHIRERYSADREAQDILAVWRELTAAKS